MRKKRWLIALLAAVGAALTVAAPEAVPVVEALADVLVPAAAPGSPVAPGPSG